MNPKYKERFNQLVDDNGGECIHCGSMKFLQFHHRDPSTKEFNISQGMTKSWEEIEREVDKCDLICRSCHKIEHDRMEGAHLVHGTLTMYQNYSCRCDECYYAMREYYNITSPPRPRYKLKNKKRKSNGNP